MSDIVYDLIHMVSTPKREGALYFFADSVPKPGNNGVAHRLDCRRSSDSFEKFLSENFADFGCKQLDHHQRSKGELLSQPFLLLPLS